MKKNRSMCFSVLHGSGVYYWNSSSDIENIQTGKKFRAMKINANVFTLPHFKLYIEMPPRIPDVEWPLDLVSIDESQSNECMESADIINSGTEKTTTYYAFLFDVPGIEKGKSLRTVVENKSGDQKDCYIKRAACGLVKVLSDLNEKGWYLSGIDLDHIYFSTDYGRIIMGFSTLYRFLNISDNYFEVNKYPMEFMEPALWIRKVFYPDVRTQNFCITATLFYLLVGRHPYNGHLVIIGGRQLQDVYFEWMRLPVFIFDPDDKSNSLGYFEEDRSYIETWGSLPEEIRNMFCRSLSKKCAERTGDDAPCNVEEWKLEFQKYGWGR